MIIKGYTSAVTAAALSNNSNGKYRPFNANGSEIAANWVFDDPSGDSGGSVVDDGGRAWLRCPVGGNSGAFFFNRIRGPILRPKGTINGPFEWRTRFELFNDAGDADPTQASGFRNGGVIIADPASFDPDATYFNYINTGGTPSSAPQKAVMWLTTDDEGLAGQSDSTAFAQTLAYASGDFLLDFKIIRRATDLQKFDIEYRRPSSQSVDIWDDSESWTTYITIDRNDNTNPDRDDNGASVNLAVALPDAVYCGFTVHSNNNPTDVSIRIDRSAMRGTTA